MGWTSAPVDAETAEQSRRVQAVIEREVREWGAAALLAGDLPIPRDVWDAHDDAMRAAALPASEAVQAAP